MSSFGERFGALVKERRDAREWTLANLALEVFGAADNTNGEGRKGDVYKLENGEIAKPRASTIKRYCDALDISQDEVDALRTPDQMPTVTQMRLLLAERDTLKAGQNLTELQVIGLAERVAENTPPDFDAALRELDHALTVAEEMKARAGQTSNHADFIDDVFAEVQRLNDQDNPDEAVETIERALEQADAQKARLLDGLIKQHELRQDVPACVQAILSKLRMDVPDASKRFDPIRAQFIEYRQQGLIHGGRFASLVAIALAVECKDHVQSAEDLGYALNIQGVALQELGLREDNPERLIDAVKAYRDASEVRQREKLWEQWAATQNNLGSVLTELGGREDGPDRLNNAIEAYQAALGVFTEEASPENWAATKNNLGIALEELGKREKSKDRLEQAVEAYNVSLKVRTKKDFPESWADTQNNLGIVLRELGRLEHNPERLNDSISACEAALEVRTRKALPVDWGRTQNNLGGTLQELGKLTRSMLHLDRAINAYQAALEVIAKDTLPMDWAFVQASLNELHLTLFDQTTDAAHLDTAQTHLDNAIEIFTRAEAGQFLKITTEQQTAINTRRAGL